MRKKIGFLLLWLGLVGWQSGRGRAEEPADPPNPFGPAQEEVRPDSLPGSITLSNGKTLTGRIWLTRGHHWRVFDPKTENVRHVPLSAVREVRATIEKEWMEKEWRFKENASDEKEFTGRAYPARMYNHELVLKRGDTIKGEVSGAVYIQETNPDPADPSVRPAPVRFLLHERDKGEIGQALEDLVYVKKIDLSSPATKPSTKPAPKPATP